MISINLFEIFHKCLYKKCKTNNQINYHIIIYTKSHHKHELHFDYVSV